MNYTNAQVGIFSKQVAVDTDSKTVETNRTQNKEELHTLFDLDLLSKTNLRIQTAISQEDINNALMEFFRALIPTKKFEFLSWNAEKKRFESLMKYFDIKTNIKRLIESGIIDWIFDEKKSAVIPDLENYNSEQQFYFIIVPIILMDKNAGIFLLQTEVEQSYISKSILSLISIIVNQAYLSVMTKKLFEERNEIKSELNYFEEQLNGAYLIGNIDDGYFHQLKNRLQVILSSIQLIQKGVDKENITNVLMKETQKVCDVTKKISEYFKPYSNLPVFEYVNLNQLLKTTVEVSRFIFNEGQISINVIENSKQPQVYTCSSFLRKVLFYFIYYLGQRVGKNGAINLETVVNEHRVTIKIQTDEINTDTDLLKNMFNEKDDIKYRAIKSRIIKYNWSIVTRLDENKRVTILLTLPKRFRSKMREPAV